jgi:hypothetical protein
MRDAQHRLVGRADRRFARFQRDMRGCGANAGDGGEGNNKRVDDARFGAENQLTKHVENSKLEHERAGEMIARDDEIAFK